MTQQENTDLLRQTQESFTALCNLKKEQKIIKDYIEEECLKEIEYANAVENIKELKKSMKIIKDAKLAHNNVKAGKLEELKNEIKTEKEVFNSFVAVAVHGGLQLKLFDNENLEYSVEVAAKLVKKL